ncbi:MAG TPA: four helix bundle protein [Candidatus Wolfebacteria bacterium]|nr:four helix bundle protein [Candidatus Wolfebacteria bacterium]
MFKVAIAHREIKETNYWLRLIKGSELDDCDELNYLIKESGELQKFLGSIVGKVRKKK